MATARRAGKHPQSKPDGSALVNTRFEPNTPLAKVGGVEYSAVFLFMAGDMEMFCNTLGLSHFGSNEPCFFCPCNRSDLPWSEFRWAARWRRRHYDDATFLRMVRPWRHGFWDWEGVSKRTIALDTMHLLDHHGVGSIILATLFAEAIRF